MVELIHQRREAGAAIVGIFHDTSVRDALATRIHDVALSEILSESRMNVEVILTNARIVTADSEFDGTVVVRDGLIAEVADRRSHVADAIDLEGDYLVPGLVELHTDNMEKHFSPRPGVKWPSLSAVMAHDTQIAAAGITTVFDSLALGDVRGDTDRVLNRERMIDAVLAASERRLFRAEHRLHLRCEIVADDAVDSVDRWIDLPLVGLLSINDHTPGQRQFLDPEKLRLYHTKKFGMTNEEFELFSARTTELHHKNAARHRREIVARAQARALPLASHDDATREHVQEAVENGMIIAEFPTTREAAQASREAGLAVLVGAPNLVMGGSHSATSPPSTFARRPGRHPLLRLCAGEPDGKRLQAAQRRGRHPLPRRCARPRSPRRAPWAWRSRRDRAGAVPTRAVRDRGRPVCGRCGAPANASSDMAGALVYAGARPAPARTPCWAAPGRCSIDLPSSSPTATSPGRTISAARTMWR